MSANPLSASKNVPKLASDKSRYQNLKRNLRKEEDKERAGAQEKLAMAIADTWIALKRFVSNSKARQRM